MPNHDRATLITVLEHVHYELDMLVQSRLLASLTTTSVQAAQFFMNLVVEARAVHGRAVSEFLLGTNNRKNAVCARDYLPNYAVDASSVDELKRVTDRVGRQMAHITTDRVTTAEHEAGAGDKGWPPDAFAALLRASGEFVDGLLASHWLTDGATREQFQRVRVLLNEASKA
jgi:hypothetical protein